jgi:hypothetical protein
MKNLIPSPQCRWGQVKLCLARGLGQGPWCLKPFFFYSPKWHC